MVRDRIPEIIRENGRISITKQLDDSMYATALRKKLEEEVAEYFESGEVLELVDILEVIYALAALEKVNSTQLEAMREQKYMERGGFKERVFLLKVE